ncbi:Regulator of ribonuclease activity A [Variovorax sp. PBL-H6]|uniref:ribonuclease E activity regulator RraA n=1 Tax=Variovorax sp. PBL-H6 TaxID=434009 RepID=UPI001316B32F|nr:ribonuclease E activity regulator RraA [Variovorax sp. PBL-H6]VTU36578.1 Regulator of ribonuclease activity A [Variovorax sp. PBL-H6]
MSMTVFKTADLCDLHRDEVQVCHAPLVGFGGRSRLTGRIATVETFEDAALVRRVLEEPADGRVLIVDGGGSRRAALLGDKMTLLAITNGWQGVVIHGAVRDVETLCRMDIAVFALNAVPARSGSIGRGTIGNQLNFGDASFVRDHYCYCDRDGLVLSRRSLLP